MTDGLISSDILVNSRGRTLGAKCEGRLQGLILGELKLGSLLHVKGQRDLFPRSLYHSIEVRGSQGGGEEGAGGRICGIKLWGAGMENG